MRFNGERVRTSHDTEYEAKRWEAQAQLEIVEGRAPTMPAGKAEVMTMRAAFDKTCVKSWDNCKARRTLVTNGMDAVDFFGPATPCSTITYPQVERYVDHLKTKGYTGSTINRKLSAFTKMMNVARLYDSNVAIPKVDKQAESPPRDVVLTADQVEALVGWPYWNPRERALTMILADTGCRFSEACPQDREHAPPIVDLEAKTITFPDPKDAHGKGAKGRLKRTLPMTKRVVQVMGYTYADFAISTVRYATYKRKFDVAVGDLGLPDGTVIHTLRHTCASRLAAMDVSAFKLQKWMGHKDIKTTQRYVEVGEDQLAGLADMLTVA